MLIQFEVRRLSFYIFLFVFICAIFTIRLEFSTKINNDTKIQSKIFEIDKIDKKDKFFRYYSGRYVILPRYGEDHIYNVGDVISVTGVVQNLLEQKDNIYSLYLKGNGYDYVIKSYDIQKMGYKNSFSRVIYYLRQNIISIIDYLYVENYAIVRALIVGDRQYITKSDTALFSKSGISHIISISGFHVVLIANIFFSILFFMHKKQRYIVSLALTFIYVLLTGCNPPCVRAYVFYITYVASIILCKRYDIFSIGFLLSSFYMAINPFILFDAGFCLSFMAVFSIAMFYRYIDSFFKKVLLRFYISEGNYFFAYIVSLISMTISASILTIPYIYYNFGIISTINILTNIISVPLIAISYPFILMSILIVKMDFFARVFVNIVDFFMNLFFRINEFFVNIPFAYFEFEKRNITIVIIFYIFLFTFYNIFIKSKVRNNMIKE